MSLELDGLTGSSFPQQGTIDWIKLGKVGVTATVTVLSRLSAAHVDPFTISIAQAIASQLILSTTGKARISECLSSLKSLTSLDGILWFGFGRQHVVHILADTSHGFSTIALCGALSEVCPLETVVAIMDELPGIYKAPSELRPSLLQWSALISNCSGVISKTNFGLVAEHFMSLDGTDPIVNSKQWGRNQINELRPYKRHSGLPSDIALALRAIAELSSGKLTSIELCGGAACGLLAAFAYWFLGLDIEIRKGPDLVYRSVLEDHSVQLLVRYVDRDNKPDISEIQLTSRSYPILSITSIVNDENKAAHGERHVLAGRIPWAKAIGMTFGGVGQELLQSSYHLGQLLGNGARIFTAFAEADTNGFPQSVPSGLRAVDSTTFNWDIVVHNERSHGKGLIHFMLTRLPELQILDRLSMESYLEHPLPRAVEEYQSAATRLAMLCGCSRCSQSKDANNYVHTKKFCLPLVAESLLILLRNLALVHPDIDLLPSRVGLENLYLEYYWPYNADGDWSSHRPYSPHRLPDLFRSTTMNDVMKTAEQIYTGRCRGAFNAPAYTAGGLTFYVDILCNFTDRLGDAALVHVIPGKIMLQNGRTYNNCQDLGFSRVSMPNARNYQPLYRLPLEPCVDTHDLQVNIIARENLNGLELGLSFTGSNGSSLTMGPMALIGRMSSVSYKVRCSRDTCSQLDGPLASTFTVDGEGLVDPKGDVEAGRLVVVRRLESNPIARCIALHQLPSPGDCDGAQGQEWTERSAYKDVMLHGNVIFRNDECWSCCIKQALRGRQQRTVYRSNSLLPVVYIL